MKKVLQFLDRHLEEYLMAFLLITLTLVMLLQIVMRYIFGHALSWPEELCRYCFVYITFFTLGFCIRRNSMLRLDILQSVLPAKVWQGLQYVVSVVSLVFFGWMFFQALSLQKAIMRTSRTSAALGIPYTYIYLATVIGFGLALLRSLQMTLRLFRGTGEKREEAEARRACCSAVLFWDWCFPSRWRPPWESPPWCPA